VSKPNLLAIDVAVGFFTNSRTLDLFELVGERAFFLPVMLWSYCGENQIDGNLAGYSWKKFSQIFSSRNFKVSEVEAKTLIGHLVQVGFMSADFQMHSWEKFNSHIAHHEEIKKQKAAAAQARWAKRAEEEGHKKKVSAAASGHHPPETTDPTAGNGLVKPPPLFRQIESCNHRLAEIKTEMEFARADVGAGPGAKAAITKQRQALTEERCKIRIRLKELHREQSGVK
jgi:hypothetical protein